MQATAQRLVQQPCCAASVLPTPVLHSHAWCASDVGRGRSNNEGALTVRTAAASHCALHYIYALRLPLLISPAAMRLVALRGKKRFGRALGSSAHSQQQTDARCERCRCTHTLQRAATSMPLQNCRTACSWRPYSQGACGLNSRSRSTQRDRNKQDNASTIKAKAAVGRRRRV